MNTWSLPQDAAAVDWEQYWNPGLFLENARNNVCKRTWQTFSLDVSGNATVYERHIANGWFQENFELQDFPFDTQVQQAAVTRALCLVKTLYD